MTTTTVEHNEGEDFGTLVIELGRDDDATIDVGNRIIRVPIYSHEAREAVDALVPLADTPEAT